MLKKYLFCFLFFSLLLCGKIQAKGITKTGHTNIRELDFYDQQSGYLILNQMSDSSIKQAYKNVGRKAFGWSVKIINDTVPIWYVSDVIFSRSNNTNQEIKITYNVKYTKTVTLEKSVSGSIGGKISGKIKGSTAALDLVIKGELSEQVKDYYEEQTDFDIVIPTQRKISLIVKGDASLSTGVGKYFLFGITIKKGTWEYIDIVTEYYELLEEKL